jgi:hypothetical protein
MASQLSDKARRGERHGHRPNPTRLGAHRPLPAAYLLLWLGGWPQPVRQRDCFGFTDKRDPNAHAEREAIRDARERFGAEALRGAVLYSTSRPCVLCEAAAADAGIARMIHGADLKDAGRPAK